MTAEQSVASALEALAKALDALGTPAMIIGGLAVIARGVPRTTLDVDVTVWAERLDLSAALRVFARHGFTPRIPDALKCAETNQVVLLRHDASGTPLDVSLARLPFEEQALSRATRMDLGGSNLPVATAEDLILYKAVAWRPRDRDDIERLLALHRSKIDLHRIRALVSEFAMLLEDAERLAEFDALLKRVLP